MNKSKLYRRYARIGSLEQLRSERHKLNTLIEVKELELKYDYLTIKESLSLSNILDLVLGRFSRVGPIIDSAIEGFSFVSSLFSKCRGRR